MKIVWDASERLLQLLALLQKRREWNAEQIAGELAVTARTVRRDISRLRDLGYPIATVHGAAGGYELEAGATLPPLMFDTDEAVATLLALRGPGCNADPGTAKAPSARWTTEQGHAAPTAADRPGSLRTFEQPRPGGHDRREYDKASKFRPILPGDYVEWFR